ncbi:hypothetical protein [Motiliproteus sp. SC1-56]|uniref:hypothetical protein n=1 Tax=Motiliproteus sp. SC1-56 TaxID=2799565 RepID=UPI001A90A304|nr:hypothetical protein [Motiliproteus sp. SC1-56]
MTNAPKIALGVFAALGILVTLKLVTGTVSVSGANICNGTLQNVYPSPDRVRSLTVEHLNCSNTGSKSTVLLGHRDTPDEFAVLLSWEAKTYQSEGLVFFPPPIAVEWYSNNEVHIMAPEESLQFKKNESREGVEVQYYSLSPLTRHSTLSPTALGSELRHYAAPSR